MGDVNNQRKFAAKRDIASTYFDQRIPIPRDDRDDNVSPKFKKKLWLYIMP